MNGWFVDSYGIIVGKLIPFPDGSIRSKVSRVSLQYDAQAGAGPFFWGISVIHWNQPTHLWGVAWLTCLWSPLVCTTRCFCLKRDRCGPISVFVYLNTRLILTPEFRWSNLSCSMVSSTGWPQKIILHLPDKHNACSPEVWDHFKKKKLVFYNAITIDFCRGTFVHTFSGGSFRKIFPGCPLVLDQSVFCLAIFWRVNFEGRSKNVDI